MGYIRFENIVKNFGSTQVLKNINLDIEKGQLVTLLGPSGRTGDGNLRQDLAGWKRNHKCRTKKKRYWYGVSAVQFIPESDG